MTLFTVSPDSSAVWVLHWRAATAQAAAFACSLPQAAKVSPSLDICMILDEHVHLHIYRVKMIDHIIDLFIRYATAKDKYQ